MNTKLITALRTAATSIENGTFTYSWTNPMRCNCGILACSLLGKSPRALQELLDDMPKDENKNQTWTHYASTVCPITGIPEHKIFKTLFQCGLTQADFHHLEFLTNADIIARMQMPTVPQKWWEVMMGKEPRKVPVNYRNGLHVALYMRAWSEILTEQGALDKVSARIKTNIPEQVES